MITLSWFIVISLITFFTSILLLYWYLEWAYDYWERKLVPHIPASSYIFGNIREVFLMRTTAARFFKDIYSRYPDRPFIGYYECHRPALLIRDFKLVKEVLTDKFEFFQYNRAYNCNPTFNQHPFFIKGDRWKASRLPFIEAVKLNKLRLMPASVSKYYQDMKKRIESTNDSIEIDGLTKRFVSDFILFWNWEIEGNGILGDKSVFQASIEEIRNKGVIKTFINILNVFDPLRFKSPVLNNLRQSLTRHITKDIDELFLSLTEQSLKKLNEYEVKQSHCFLNSFHQSRSKFLCPANEGRSLFAFYNSYLVSIYVDSVYTISRILSSALYVLAFHPDIKSQLKKEVDTLAEEQLNLESVHVLKLKYLDMFLTEIMRLYSPVTQIRKVCTKKCELGSITIDADTTITVSLSGLKADPNYFPEPEKFDPERFAEKDEMLNSLIQCFSYGLGPRACPGNKFAIYMMKSLICHVVRDFDILPADCNENESKEHEVQSSASLFSAPQLIYINLKKNT